MGFLLFVIFLCVLDYIHFRHKHSKPDGPPVWYFFPFIGIAPFFILPKFLFNPLFRFYLKYFPDVIYTRFFYPCAFVKNGAVEDVQNSDTCLSRPRFAFVNVLTHILTGKSTWFLFDGNNKEVDFRGIRKTNLAALNVLPRHQKFERTAVIVDHFLKTIDERKGRLWNYADDLAYAKIQETSNVNLGETFDVTSRSSLQGYIDYVKSGSKHLSRIFILINFFPRALVLKFEAFCPQRLRPTVLKTLYAEFTQRFFKRKSREIDEPRDFVEAVLRLKKPEAALDFMRETVLFNMLATTHTTQHNTMTALSYISLNKRVQQKIHEELDQVVGSSPLNIDHLRHLHYLKAVCHESNRLSLPIPMIPRLTSAPTKIGGYTLDSDTTIATFLVSEAVNEENFSHPDDFIPERYINDKGEFVSSKHFNAFSRGKRMCSGVEIGHLSVHVYCAKILQHFELFPESLDREVPRYEGGLLLRQPNIPLRFVRRDGSPEIKPAVLPSGMSAFVEEVMREMMSNV